MLSLPAGRDASAGAGAPLHAGHRPERTLLYQLVREYYPAFTAHLAAQGTVLPSYVEREFEAYLGPHRGGKVFTLQTLSVGDEPFDNGVGKLVGFSLHAGVAARADERQKLERLCRCIEDAEVIEKILTHLESKAA